MVVLVVSCKPLVHLLCILSPTNQVFLISVPSAHGDRSLSGSLFSFPSAVLVSVTASVLCPRPRPRPAPLSTAFARLAFGRLYSPFVQRLPVPVLCPASVRPTSARPCPLSGVRWCSVRTVSSSTVFTRPAFGPILCPRSGACRDACKPSRSTPSISLHSSTSSSLSRVMMTPPNSLRFPVRFLLALPHLLCLLLGSVNGGPSLLLPRAAAPPHPRSA